MGHNTEVADSQANTEAGENAAAAPSSATRANPICRARALAKQVQGPSGVLDILTGVDLEVARGEAVAIVGASGSGKSTLLGLLAGLDRASSGSVELCGSPLEPLDEDARAALRAGRVGFVFQSFQLIPTLTALENVRLPLELASVLSASSARRTAEAALERVGLSERGGHYPRQLSGGEQQRVAIARAFAPGPEVLFADEPTGNLDEATGGRIIDLLFGLREDAGAALVLVTHDPALASRCDRRLGMSAGHLEAR
ncbi:ABC transporter [Halochromatium salexigens]|uniref:ABC transporter n=1 Tax=Halochromatium salexigens TaxID=49447 RepID=A0AAJ0XG98_HALSE|nr:ABC transporter [Halochromatium salexigens]